MKPAPFRYLRPSSVDEVVAVLAEHRADATVLAGGQSLLPLLNQRHRRPTVVVDLTAVTELRRVVTGGDEVELGALVGQQLPAAVASSLPLLVLALPHVGHVQTRNRGTIAGSVAHGDPLAEVPLAMLVGGGAVELVSARGRRLVPIDDFLDRAFAPARADDELVVATHWARPEPGVGHGFVELTSGTTVAAAAAVASVDGGRVESVRVGVAGPVDRPMLITAELLPPVDGTDPGAVTALGRRLGSGLVDGVAFIDDTTSHSAHRRAVAVELVCRALRAAVADGMRGADEEKSADAPGVDPVDGGLGAAVGSTVEVRSNRNPDPVGDIESESVVAIRLMVDGRVRQATVESRTSLADALRTVGVTGVKVGCEQGVCGSCTVLLDGSSQRSCLVFAVQATGVEITTAAGLSGPIDELRAAFVDQFAVQCGFCASGVLVTAAAELAERAEAGTLDDLRGDTIAGLLSGNVCRCTGYGSMVAAIGQAARRLAE